MMKEKLSKIIDIETLIEKHILISFVFILLILLFGGLVALDFIPIRVTNEAIVLSEDWTTINTTNAPTKGLGTPGIWTGTEVIFWGNGHARGGKYNPVTDSWNSISATNEPADRWVHSMIWTGTEMIVWGGRELALNNNYNTGGRYNPVTDTWTATSTVNAPSARKQHSAVWTGTEMIIWGGGTGYVNFSDQKKYNPTTDIWTDISNVNAPSTRISHRAVWTGDKMIIWGGSTSVSGSGGLQNTGGIYDPVTDTWTTMSTVNAPDPRQNPYMVWTGTDLIVIGGSYANNGGVGLLDGGKYNLATDTWTSIANPPLTNSGANALYFREAYWTGSVVVCIVDPNGSLEGGIYDPVADVWYPINEDPSISTSTFATSVWTDYGVVIWGGQTQVAEHKYNFQFGYQVDNVDTSVNILDSSANNIELTGSNGLNGLNNTIVEDASTNFKVAEFPNVNYTEDLDWNNLTADADLGAGKSFTHITGGTLEGFTGSFSIFVPHNTGDDGVRYCPNASNLTEVSLSCGGGIDLSDGETVSGITANLINDSGLKWQLDGVTGSGGQSYVQPTPTPTNTPIPTATSTPTPVPTSTPLPTSTPNPTSVPTSVPTSIPAVTSVPSSIPTPTSSVTTSSSGKYFIVDLPETLEAVDQTGLSAETGDGLEGVNEILVSVEENNVPLAKFERVNFDRDLNWSTIIADLDILAKKSLVHIDSTLQGVDGTYTLFIPKDAIDNQVHFCPKALTLAEVDILCKNGFRISNGQEVNGIHAEIATINSLPMWSLDGVTGSGAVSVYNALLDTPTPTDLPSPSLTPVDNSIFNLPDTGSEEAGDLLGLEAFFSNLRDSLAFLDGITLLFLQLIPLLLAGILNLISYLGVFIPADDEGKEEGTLFAKIRSSINRVNVVLMIFGFVFSIVALLLSLSPFNVAVIVVYILFGVLLMYKRLNEN